MIPTSNYPEKASSMADLITRLSLAADRLEAAVDGLTAEECERIVAEDEFSIRGCVEHVAEAGLGWSEIFYDAVEGVYETPKSRDNMWKAPLSVRVVSGLAEALAVFRQQNQAIAEFLSALPDTDFDRDFRIVGFLTEPFQIKESVNWGLVIHCDYHLATIYKLRTLLGTPLPWMAVYLERFPRPS